MQRARHRRRRKRLQTFRSLWTFAYLGSRRGTACRCRECRPGKHRSSGDSPGSQPSPVPTCVTMETTCQGSYPLNWGEREPTRHLHGVLLVRGVLRGDGPAAQDGKHEDSVSETTTIAPPGILLLFISWLLSSLSTGCQLPQGSNAGSAPRGQCHVVERPSSPAGSHAVEITGTAAGVDGRSFADVADGPRQAFRPPPMPSPKSADRGNVRAFEREGRAWPLASPARAVTSSRTA